MRNIESIEVTSLKSTKIRCSEWEDISRSIQKYIVNAKAEEEKIKDNKKSNIEKDRLTFTNEKKK